MNRNQLQPHTSTVYIQVWRQTDKQVIWVQSLVKFLIFSYFSLTKFNYFFTVGGTGNNPFCRNLYGGGFWPWYKNYKDQWQIFVIYCPSTSFVRHRGHRQQDVPWRLGGLEWLHLLLLLCAGFHDVVRGQGKLHCSGGPSCQHHLSRRAPVHKG